MYPRETLLAESYGSMNDGRVDVEETHMIHALLNDVVQLVGRRLWSPTRDQPGGSESSAPAIPGIPTSKTGSRVPPPSVRGLSQYESSVSEIMIPHASWSSELRKWRSARKQPPRALKLTLT